MHISIFLKYQNKTRIFTMKLEHLYENKDLQKIKFCCQEDF